MKPLLENFSSYLARGGYVMWPLMIGAVVLWYSLACRWFMLRRRTKKSIGELTAAQPGQPGRGSGIISTTAGVFQSLLQVPPEARQTGFDIAVAGAESAASRYRVLIRTITIIAPLAGLLGTVTGMIEMFESLEQQVFYSQGGGVANGISQALFTTQLGLAIAIPGMIAGKLLERKERAIMEEINRFRTAFLQRQGEDSGL